MLKKLIILHFNVFKSFFKIKFYTANYILIRGIKKIYSGEQTLTVRVYLLHYSNADKRIDIIFIIIVCVVCCIGIHSTFVYKNTNEKIERITEFFAYAMAINTIVFILFPLIYYMVNYDILDSQEETFFLRFMFWSVLLAMKM